MKAHRSGVVAPYTRTEGTRMSVNSDTALERLDLSLPTYVALKRAQLDTVADLLAMPVRDIARVFRGQRESLEELLAELALRSRRSLLGSDDRSGLAAEPILALDVRAAAEAKLVSSGLGTMGSLTQAPRALLERLLGKVTTDALLVKVWAYFVVAGADMDGAPAPGWVEEYCVRHRSRSSDARDESLIGLLLADAARLAPLNRAEEVLLPVRIRQGRVGGHGAGAPDDGQGPHGPSERPVQRARLARARMAEATVAWAVHWAQDCGECGLDFLDVVQEASVGLLRAADRFDHHVGTRFYVYAWWWARQGIARATWEQGYPLRVPPHVHERVTQLEDARAQLRNNLAREPSPLELAVALGLLSSDDTLRVERALTRGTMLPTSVRRRLDRATKKVTRLLPLSSPPIPLDATLGDRCARRDPDLDRRLDEAGLNADEWTGHSIGELLLCESASDPLEVEAKDELKRQVGGALSSLGHRERLVLELRYGFMDGKDRTLEEIGQVMGVTRERVRQIEARGLKKLRHPERSRMLRDYLT
jgi:RNA polymerase primary sigma factor